MIGKFTGSFELVPIPPKHWWNSTMYEFRSNPYSPIAYHVGLIEYQPDHHFKTDGGSIPKLVQLIPCFQRDRFWRSYAFHDSAYKHGWIYVNGMQTPIYRDQADAMLHDMILVEHGTDTTANTVYAFVRAFGWASWRE